MISSNFGFGEQSAIASAYTKMYAPKDVTESCCGCSKKSEKKVEKKAAKKSVKESAAGKLPTKHTPPKGTGSKLGARKMLDFKKRDAKPMCKGTKKCCTEGFCISDGEKTLCTNDVGESYFSETGITGETRIYESAVSALKDIKKVNALRKPSKKYNIRKCQCVGESFEFVNSEKVVNEAWWNPVDAVSNVANAVTGGAKALGDVGGNLVKGVGNAVGEIPVVGGVVKGATDAVGNGISGVTNTVADTANGVVGAVTNPINKGVDTLANYMKGDDKKDHGTVAANGNQTSNSATQTTPAAPAQQTAPAATAQQTTQAADATQQPLTDSQKKEAEKGAGPISADAAAKKQEEEKKETPSVPQSPLSAGMGAETTSVINSVIPTAPKSQNSGAALRGGIAGSGNAGTSDAAKKTAQQAADSITADSGNGQPSVGPTVANAEQQNKQQGTSAAPTTTSNPLYSGAKKVVDALTSSSQDQRADIKALNDKKASLEKQLRELQTEIDRANGDISQKSIDVGGYGGWSGAGLGGGLR